MEKESTNTAQLSVVDDIAVLKIGDESFRVKDYKISSSMHGGTELEVTICMDGGISVFETSARKEA